ncbi:MAG: glycosyltransferase family 39 protein [Vicinamibacterales bacterium]
MSRSSAWLILPIVAGVVIRAGLRLAAGEDAFLTHGYTFYLTLAHSFLAGDGLCYAPGESCASRLPVYPLFLAGFIQAGVLYPGVVIAQSIIGAGVGWMAWRIGNELFAPPVGLLAAAATAFNPYAVIHDTALQDTVLLNFLMAAALACLLAARRTRRNGLWLAAGIVLGLAILTAARVAFFAPFAIAWVAAVGGTNRRERMRAAVVVALPIVLLTGAWTMRNWRVVGAPVLTSEFGRSLYLGNNPLTFSHFPEESIDLTVDGLPQLSPDGYRSIERLAGQDVARDALFRRMGLEYVRANPGTAAWGSARKLWVILSAQLSPAREPVVQWAYRSVFLSAHLLAIVGLWRARRDWRVHALMWGLVLSFAITTAVFWAHTSHTGYLDPILFAYASAGLYRLANHQ